MSPVPSDRPAAPAPLLASLAPSTATATEQAGTRVDVGLGTQVTVVADLLLPAEPLPSSLALASDVAATLDRWEGPGTVIVCGNLFAGGADALVASRAQATLAAHDALAVAIRAFTGRPGRRLIVLPGWRDPQVASDPGVVTELYTLGAEVAPSVDLRLHTAAGERQVLVRPGCPTGAAATPGGFADRPASGPSDGPADGGGGGPSWLAGADRLEDPDDSARFVRSRTLYRRLGRLVWVPPLVAVVAVLVIRLTVVFRGVYHLVHRSTGPRRVLVRAYGASWPSRLVFTVVVVMALEAAVAVVAAVASRRAWKSAGGGVLAAPRRARGDGGGNDDPSASGGLRIGGVGALDEARALVGREAAGLVTGGTLRAELTHLGPGFFACAGGTTELVREHRGRLGLPPVFLHHRQASWIELEAGADLHVRLLLADVDLPGSAPLERIATGYPAVKGRKAAADLHPEMVASWPRGASWPPAPGAVADRVRARRVRRVAAGAIFLAGLVDLLAAVSRPAAGHLHLVREYLPLAVAQAAGALVALAGIALVMLARGALRGQRRAWLAATVLLATTLVLHLVHGGSPGVLLLTIVVLVFLLVEHDLFGAAADQASARTAVATLAAGGAVAVAGASLAVEVGSRIHRLHVGPLPSWPRVLLAVTERLVGLHSVALPEAVDRWISPSLLAVGIALAVVTLFLLTRPVVDRTLSAGRAPTDRAEAGRVEEPGRVEPTRQAGLTERSRTVSARWAAELRARDIVRRHGTGTLDYFALRDDKQWFFHRDSLVAHAVYNGMCLVSPDPIGPHGERPQTWDAFRRHCDRRGWGVAVMAAAEEWLPLYRVGGMRHVYIGDEALVDVQRFSLQGGRMKGLRQAVNRVERYGYSARFLDPARVSPGTAEPLVDLIGRNRRGTQERGFSMMLGRMFDPRDAGLLLTAVYGPDDEPAAVCQFVPAPAVGGYSLDLMRRDPGDHPNGLLDFALCSTIEHLRERRQQGLSLNFAAMRSTLEGESGDGVAQRVERWALRRMSGVLQIESLWRFNAKYEPGWLPRYVVYDSAEQFAPAVLSILRAESLSEVPVVGRFLLPAGGRR